MSSLNFNSPPSEANDTSYLQSLVASPPLLSESPPTDPPPPPSTTPSNPSSPPPPISSSPPPIDSLSSISPPPPATVVTNLSPPPSTASTNSPPINSSPETPYSSPPPPTPSIISSSHSPSNFTTNQFTPPVSISSPVSVASPSPPPFNVPVSNTSDYRSVPSSPTDSLSPPVSSVPVTPLSSDSPVIQSPISTTTNTSSPSLPTPSTLSPKQITQLVPTSSPTIVDPPNQSPTNSSDSSNVLQTGSIIAIGVVGLVAAFLVSLVFFLIRKRKNNKKPSYLDPIKPIPGRLKIGAEGNHHNETTEKGSQESSFYAANPQISPFRSNSGSHIAQAFQPGTSDIGLGNSKSCFTYEELMHITNGFSHENMLGEGGFGCVYKGQLPDGREVAVKPLKSGSGQGEREFQAEVDIISRIHHRHLVSLVGYCIEDQHRVLVYEFVPNNTLEHHLHGKGKPVMDWQKRVKIAVGAAKGLAYLHEDCHPRIIHRDIKSANILLDNSFEAQVADFGLAKLTNDTNTHVSTRVMGTFGYMAPEYASSGKLTDRSDVFSFGVVLLELITGRKPVDPSQRLGDESLVEWARPLLIRTLDTEHFEEIVDPRLERNYVESEMFRMMEAATACVRHSAQKRPRMVQVARALESLGSEGDLSDLSNGVKFGQSTVYDSTSYSSQMQRFRRLAFDSDDSGSEFEDSGEYSGSSRP